MCWGMSTAKIYIVGIEPEIIGAILLNENIKPSDSYNLIRHLKVKIYLKLTLLGISALYYCNNV